MKYLICIGLFLGILAVPSCKAQLSPDKTKLVIGTMVDAWHAAAARADHASYFKHMADPSVFIGTDPTENWKKQEFKVWSAPYFTQGKAWSFTLLQRNIFLGKGNEFGWFDELLETQMGICRGSGVVVKEDGSWKIKHYVLSITIPNKDVKSVTELKKEFDKKLIQRIKSQ